MGDDVFSLCHRFVDDYAALRPIDASFMGVPGHDGEWGDHSPDGHEAVADRWRRLLADLGALPAPSSHWDGLARRVAEDAAALELEAHEHGDHLRDVAHMASFCDALRDVFDVMDTATPEGWSDVARRLETIAEPVAGYEACLALGRDRGLVPAARQVRSVIAQLRDSVTPTGRIGRIPEELADSGLADREADLRGRIERAVAVAVPALAELADHLEREVLPTAAAEDGVGPERYRRAARRHLGMDLDVEETYAWAWDHIGALTGEITAAAREIDPSRDLDGVIELLKTDPSRAAASPEEFRALMQERQEQALTDLDGVHFDIPDPIRQVEVRLAAAGVPPGAWYLPPAEDWSRPGQVFWSLGSKQQVPLYEEISTAYHEGFPGHHLQAGTQVALSDRLSRLHRVMYWNPGYGEGWALYAERLMRELGYFERPDYVVGQLTGSLLRAVRVVVDLGNHLDLPIPASAPFHPGERWSFELGVEMLERVAFLDHEYATSEMTRYLGWPAQAISYKVGEKVLLDLRDRVRADQGAAFDPKAFHAAVIGSGPVGLDLLRELVIDM